MVVVGQSLGRQIGGSWWTGLQIWIWIDIQGSGAQLRSTQPSANEREPASSCCRVSFRLTKHKMQTLSEYRGELKGLHPFVIYCCRPTACHRLPHSNLRKDFLNISQPRTSILVILEYILCETCPTQVLHKYRCRFNL